MRHESLSHTLMWWTLWTITYLSVFTGDNLRFVLLLVISPCHVCDWTMQRTVYVVIQTALDLLLVCCQ